MFREIREGYGLTRSDLAALTHRSPNYLLKAEQLTFPSAPVALLDLYSNPQEPKDWPSLSEVEWEPLDRYTLESAYRDAQRHKREEWILHYAPMPSRLSFCKQWVSIESHEDEFDMVYPTEYRVSQGLCVPAPAVYRAEKHGHISAPIKTALSDLVEYCVSGRAVLTLDNNRMDAQQTVRGVLQVAKNYGVGYQNGAA